MGDMGQSRRWIVLLNKAPKGPFVEEEIRELLAQGILRRNDLASVQDPTKKGEWKLLWQFPEFDRRSATVSAEDAAAEEQTRIAERRKVAAAEELRKQALAELPKNWSDIAPEDLLPHSTSTQSIPEAPLPTEAVERTLQMQEGGVSRMRLGLLIGMALLGVGYWVRRKPPEVREPVAASAPTQMPTMVPRVETPKRIPAEMRPEAAPTSVPAARMRAPVYDDAPVEDHREAERGEIEAPSESDARGESKPTIKSRKKTKQVVPDTNEEEPPPQELEEPVAEDDAEAPPPEEGPIEEE